MPEPEPMQYFYDFEFIDDGRTIEPISVGICADDGREYYAVFADVDMQRVKARPWLVANVLEQLPLNNRGALKTYLDTDLADTDAAELLSLVDLDRTHPDVRPREVIAEQVRAFLLDVPEGRTIELVGDYCAYDHVVLAQLWGPMNDLPPGIPMFSRDVQDYARHLGVTWDYLPQPGPDTEHQALADAHLARERWQFLRHVEAARRRGIIPEQTQ